MPTRVTDQPAMQTIAHACDGRSTKSRGDLFAEESAMVRRLYTVAMMADVLGVAVAAVRHWRRVGLVTPFRVVGSIAWFDFSQLVLARELARLLRAGLSLREIDSKLGAFAGGAGAAAAAIADRVVVDGRRLSLRQADDRLEGPGGQLQLDFYAQPLGSDMPSDDPTAAPAIPLGRPEEGPTMAGPDLPTVEGSPADELLDLAADLEAAGQFTEAAEALRAVLQAEGPSARISFMLAELLYHAGDLGGARERYYAAIELDPDHLEARTSLGCILAETGDCELAVAAFDGVLRQQPDYADAHWHMAAALEQLGFDAEARRHLITFLAIAPESPWAELARCRLR
jgi:tetratricopeptide (TPR) repeat protein